MEKIIEVKNLKKSYGNVKAVKGIDFYVEKGKMFAFLGPNGAGKSTTIDMICTFLKPDEGSVIIDGCQLSKEDHKIREKIGVVFQDSVLDARLTVKENLTVRARFYMKKKEDIKKAIQRVTKAAGLDEFLNRPYGKLSGGQRRRADIARALLHTPKILFMDEPTTGLDPQTRKNVWNMVMKLQKDLGMTVFLTTHYMEEAAQADYIIIADHGEVAVKGTPYELREQYSRDVLKIKPYAESERFLIHALDEKRIKHQKEAERITVPIKSSKEAIQLLHELENHIENFEVIHGTMDDVFLNITGEEIRNYA